MLISSIAVHESPPQTIILKLEAFHMTAGSSNLFKVWSCGDNITSHFAKVAAKNHKSGCKNLEEAARFSKDFKRLWMLLYP